jgi:hypothetical protein
MFLQFAYMINTKVKSMDALIKVSMTSISVNYDSHY